MENDQNMIWPENKCFLWKMELDCVYVYVCVYK